MARFAPGNPGRPKGSKNRSTREVKDFCVKVFDRPEYLVGLIVRIDEGRAPHMEKFLAEHHWGKTPDHVTIDGAPPVMVIDELTAADVADQLRDRE